MSATTPFLNLYKPGGGSTGLIVPDEVVDVDRFNTNFDSIDAWAQTTDTFRLSQLTRGQQYRGLAANIGSISTPQRGDTYQETDGSFQKFEYDGTSWVAGAGRGLSLVKPTSVSGTNVTESGGRVTAANSPEMILDGVFTTAFRRFQLILEVDSQTVSTNFYMQLRVAGANQNAAATYITQVSYNSSDTTFITQKNAAAIQAEIGQGASTNPRQITLDFSSPAVNGPTTISGKNIALLSAHHVFGDMHIRHSPSAVIDGIRLYPSSGNFSGVASVYAYA